MSEQQPTPDKKESATDLAAMLGMGGILDGVSSIISKFGELAERGESLRKSMGETGETSTGKPFQSSAGFSIKFGAAGNNASSSDAMNVAPVNRSSQFNSNAAKSTRPTASASTSTPPKTREPQVDIIEEEDHVLLVAEMPGVASEAVSLNFNDRQLSIEGSSKTAHFKSQIELPHVYSQEQVTVTANNGVIEIRLQNK